jgi:DNA-directed RNA polymerase subunit RPC12/RpoP
MMEIRLQKCPNCGARLKRDNHDDSFFCAYCGAEIFDAGMRGTQSRSTRETLSRKDDGPDKADRVMFCQKCGNRVNGGSFCPTCGAQIGQTVQQTPQPIIVNVMNANSTPVHDGYPYRSKWAAFFLCFLFGGLGVHRFYVGKTGTGILWLLTVGFFGFGWFIDLLLILFGGFRDKAGYPLR